MKHMVWMMGIAVILAMIAICMGSTGLDSVVITLIPQSIFGYKTSIDKATALQIILQIRLPRILCAWLAGALLGMAGSIAQGLFRNPLADPYLLGSASGASLGVAIVMALFASHEGGGGFSVIGYTGAAFLGSLLAIFIALVLANGISESLRLLLAGVVVGIIFAAMTQLIFFLHPRLMVESQSFMLGSVAYVNWQTVVYLAVAMLFSLAVALPCTKLLDALRLGELTAKSLGLPMRAMRSLLMIVFALATAASVSRVGLIAFVGLVAPHMVRQKYNGHFLFFLLLSSAIGGNLLLVADTFARWIVAPQELPVGIVTAIMGGAYLLWLMRKNMGRSRT